MTGVLAKATAENPPPIWWRVFNSMDYFEWILNFNRQELERVLTAAVGNYPFPFFHLDARPYALKSMTAMVPFNRIPLQKNKGDFDLLMRRERGIFDIGYAGYELKAFYHSKNDVITPKHKKQKNIRKYKYQIEKLSQGPCRWIGFIEIHFFESGNLKSIDKIETISTELVESCVKFGATYAQLFVQLPPQSDGLLNYDGVIFYPAKYYNFGKDRIRGIRSVLSLLVTKLIARKMKKLGELPGQYNYYCISCKKITPLNPGIGIGDYHIACCCHCLNPLIADRKTAKSQ
ncbi:MAG: hypothetical protein AAB473_02800 [Patescibacteria group bacterium]